MIISPAGTTNSDGTSVKRVLVVDDDPGTLRMMSGWLTEAGLDVVTMSQFAEARNYLAAWKPDVLITDLRLGAFNGLQLVLLGKARRPEMTAIVVTGFDDPVLRQETQSAGADYLTKPVGPGELLDTINREL